MYGLPRLLLLAVAVTQASVLPHPQTADGTQTRETKVVTVKKEVKAVKQVTLPHIVHEDSQEPSVYRPWEKRYEQRDPGLSYNEQVWQEHRYGWVRFKERNPYHPWAPNAEDREAETYASLVYVGVGMGTVLVGFLADLSMDHDKGVTEKLDGAAALILLPWILGNVWAIVVGARNVAAPDRLARYPHTSCELCTVYLIFVPVITLLSGWAFMAWVLGVNARRRLTQQKALAVQAQSQLAAVHALSAQISALEAQVEASAGSFLASSSVRVGLLLAEIAALSCGVWLSYTVESIICVPEVWWTMFCYTTTMMSIVAVITLGVFWLTVLMSIEEPAVDLIEKGHQAVETRKRRTQQRLRNLQRGLHGETDADIQRALSPSAQDGAAAVYFATHPDLQGAAAAGPARPADTDYGACGIATVSPGAQHAHGYAAQPQRFSSGPAN